MFDLKKQSIGFYCMLVTIVLTVAGLVSYLSNCGTTYFSNFGKNPVVLGGMIVALLLEIALVVLAQKGQKNYLDIIPVAISVLLIWAAITFINSRINGIASIMTFENNASNMADLSNAITAMVICVIAAVVSMVSAFFDIVKE